MCSDDLINNGVFIQGRGKFTFVMLKLNAISVQYPCIRLLVYSGRKILFEGLETNMEYYTIK
jgi:hypothetical protein